MEMCQRSSASFSPVAVEEKSRELRANDVSLYKFKDNDVRVATINGKVYFIAVDLCNAIGLSNATKALLRLFDDEKITLKSIQGYSHEINAVTESGMYSLVLGSRKPEARIFQRWVTHEVLPCIRQHGVYATDPAIARFQQDPEEIKTLITSVDTHKQMIRQIEDERNQYKQALVNYKTDHFWESVEDDIEHFAAASSCIDLNLEYLKFMYVVYIIEIPEFQVINEQKARVFEFGFSGDIKRRYKEHQKIYPGCRLLHLQIVNHGSQAEQLVKKYLDDNELRTIFVRKNGSKDTETFVPTPTFPLQKIIGYIHSMCLKWTPISLTELYISNIERDIEQYKQDLDEYKKTCEKYEAMIKKKNADIAALHTKYNRTAKIYENARVFSNDLKQKVDILEHTVADYKHKNDKLEFENNRLQDILSNLSANLSKQPSQVSSSNSANSSSNSSANNAEESDKNDKQNETKVDTTNLVVCIVCNKPQLVENFGAWSNGNHKFECHECDAKRDPYVLDVTRASKKCTYCALLKNVECFYFKTFKNKPSKYTAQCKDCEMGSQKFTDRLRNIDHYIHEQEKIKRFAVGESWCGNCKKFKDIKCFCNSKARINGINNTCRSCVQIRVSHTKTLKQLKAECKSKFEDN